MNENLLFLKKKKQKNFCILRPKRSNQHRPEAIKSFLRALRADDVAAKPRGLNRPPVAVQKSASSLFVTI
jgi:hypothetical protein